MDSMRSLLSTSDFLQVREHKLSNDLTVWLNEDHSQPKIFGAVVVKAGAKDSPNTGIAHYFEHMMFKGTDKIVGSVDFNHRHEDDVLEIGYTLHPDYWGRGYVPEAARALIDLAFKELGLHKIELVCFGYNIQSQRVAEKLGFTLEARIRDRKDAQGNRCDSLIYGLLKSEWETQDQH